MNASESSFSETNQKRRLKLCGNCARISFGLNKEEKEFLMETIKFYGLAAMRNWLKLSVVKGPHGEVNLEKMRVVQTILKHRRFCIAAAVEVFCVDTQCFLWQSESPACTLPQENHSIRQRVFRELQQNPGLTPKMLCGALGLAWPKYQNYVKSLCTEYQRLLRNKYAISQTGL
jgi:hypothetical protein